MKDNKEIEYLPCVATIGSFDGVHLGHQYLIGQVIEQAKVRGLKPIVITFPNHPLQVLRPDLHPKMLTLKDDKVEKLCNMGVDVSLIEFTKELSALTAREFMQQVLKERLNVKVLIIGYDNRFGSDRKSFPEYVKYGKELGIEVLQSRELPSDIKASSTLVREAISQGDIISANQILGHSYSIRGTVVKGFNIGTKIGFPTANVTVNPDKLIPKNGVYCVRALGYIGMMNIGYRPTLDNGPQRSLEVHLLDFDGNIYGNEIEIEFIRFIRNEQKFDSIEELTKQLEQDKIAIQHFFLGKLESASR